MPPYVKRAYVRHKERDLCDLPDSAAMTFQQIGEALGISTVRANRIYLTAMRKLRRKRTLQALAKEINERAVGFGSAYILTTHGRHVLR